MGFRFLKFQRLNSYMPRLSVCPKVCLFDLNEKSSEKIQNITPVINDSHFQSLR
jgi:hypothetical protein